MKQLPHPPSAYLIYRTRIKIYEDGSRDEFSRAGFGEDGGELAGGVEGGGGGGGVGEAAGEEAVFEEVAREGKGG